MKLGKIFILLILLPMAAKAELGILSWKEFIQLNNDGKKAIIKIQGQVKNLEQNHVMTAFAIGFDPEQHILIKEVTIDDKLAQYEFVDNELKVNFPNSRANNQMVSIGISYLESYDKVDKYLRHEFIYVPDFAVGAIASVVINFSGYDLTTYTNRVIPDESSLTYTAIVPKEGIKEIIKFTPTSKIWDVKVKAKVTANKPLGEFSLKFPDYFRAGRQKVENYSNSFSSNAILTDRKGSDITYNFRVHDNRFEAVAKAKISTGAPYRRQIMRNMINYTKVSEEERILLTPLLQKIRSDKAYAEMPMHAAIGKFVHGYMEYEIDYMGKLPSLAEIVKDKTGVCTEYAKLYDALARLSGIPSLIIDGAACGEYDKCQGHSWNMIFYDSRWIEVDPTWNLMSGIVSSSHIYINDGNKGQVEIRYPENVGKVTMEMDLEMEEIEQNSLTKQNTL